MLAHIRQLGDCNATQLAALCNVSKAVVSRFCRHIGLEDFLQRAGQPIVRIDRRLVAQKGYDTTTMLIITDDGGKGIAFHEFGAIRQGTVLS